MNDNFVIFKRIFDIGIAKLYKLLLTCTIELITSASANNNLINVRLKNKLKLIGNI